MTVRSGAHILLVEDNVINQEVASQFVGSLGLDVDIANHGGEAIERVSARQYDLILMDMQMPVMDGLECTKRIRMMPHGKNLPIVAMTANAFEEDRQRCFAAGMNDFIAKPVDPNQLQSLLTRWLPNISVAEPVGAMSDIHDINASVELVDYAQGLKRLAGNRTLYEDMLTRFIDNHTFEAERISQCCEASDMDTAQRLSHSLKGVAGTLALTRVHQEASELNQLIKNSSTDSTITQKVDRLAHAISDTIDHIHRLIQTPEKQTTSQPSQDIVKLREQLAALHDELATDDMAAAERWRIIAAHLRDLGGELAAQLQIAIEQYDFPKALTLLDTLLEQQPELARQTS